MERIQESVEDAISDQLISHQQAGQTIAAFEKALSGYTYLTPPPKNRIDASVLDIPKRQQRMPVPRR
jgi:arginine decarboxylase